MHILASFGGDENQFSNFTYCKFCYITYNDINTKILEVSLFAFTYRLFHEDFSPINGALHDTQPLSSFIYFNLVGFLNGY